MTDIKKAKLDPTAVYKSPGEVLEDKTLSREDKIEILRVWEYDAREIQVAEEENMPSANSQMLDEVLETLKKLNAGPETKKYAPNKQGGV